MGQIGADFGQLEHEGRGGDASYRTPPADSAAGSVNRATPLDGSAAGSEGVADHLQGVAAGSQGALPDEARGADVGDLGAAQDGVGVAGDAPLIHTSSTSWTRSTAGGRQRSGWGSTARRSGGR